MDDKGLIMSKENIFNKLKKYIKGSKFLNTWSKFIQVIFNPYILVLLGLIYLLSKQNALSNYNDIHGIIIILISIFASIIGGIAVSKWIDFHEGDKLKTRGFASIRSLLHLLAIISSLSHRIEIFLSNSKSYIDDDNIKRIIITNFEEIENISGVLKKGTMHSIENWQDVIPDADNVIQLSNLIEEKTKSKSELDELKKVLQKGLQQSQEEKERALKLLVEKEERINNLEESIITLKSNIDPSITSYGFRIPFENIRTRFQYNYQCNDCKNKFFLNIMEAISISHKSPAHECPKCKSNNISPIK